MPSSAMQGIESLFEQRKTLLLEICKQGRLQRSSCSRMSGRQLGSWMRRRSHLTSPEDKVDLLPFLCLQGHRLRLCYVQEPVGPDDADRVAQTHQIEKQVSYTSQLLVKTTEIGVTNSPHWIHDCCCCSVELETWHLGVRFLTKTQVSGSIHEHYVHDQSSDA